jgi:hypothetical protein
METLLILLTNTTVVFTLKSYTNPLNKQQINVRPFNLQEGGMVIFPESDFFFLHQNQNFFFSNIGNQNI